MSDAFDPYHQWLGIALDEQPPNHYRLLGLRQFEDDAAVIGNAADRQMAHLRTFQAGTHGALSQQLLNEVATARVCLLNPQQKTAYDSELRAALAPVQQPARGVSQPPRWPVPAAGGVLLLVVLLLAAVFLNSGGDSQVAESENKQPAATVTPDDQSAVEPPAGELPPAAEPQPIKLARTLIEPTSAEPEQMSVAAQTSVDRLPSQTSSSELAAMAMQTPNDTPKPAQNTPSASTTPIAKAKPASKRLPIPEGPAQHKVLDQIETVYKIDEQKTSDAKWATAKELAMAAYRVEDQPVQYYVLLRRAAELAAEAGDTDLVFSLIDLMGERFELDTLAAKQITMSTLAEGRKSTEAIESLIAAASELTAQAVARRQFDAALDVAAAVNRACQRSSVGRELRKKAANLHDQVERQQKQWQPAEQALATLATKPDDPEANLVAGRWLAFINGDWSAGLKHLSNGSDAAIQTLAKQDIESPPTSAADQATRGDAWYGLGQSNQDANRDGLLLRAAYWYALAESKLPQGLLKIKVKKRLDELADIPRPTPPTDVASDNRWSDLLAHAVPGRDTITGKWRRLGDTLVLEERSGRIMLRHPIRGDYDLEFVFARTIGDDSVYAIFPAGPTACDLLLNGWHDRMSGLEKIDFRRVLDNASTVAPAPIVNGQEHRVLVRVRTSRTDAWIEVLFDGNRYLRWTGSLSSLHPAIGLLNPHCIGLGAGQPASFHMARVRPTSAAPPEGMTGPSVDAPIVDVVIDKANYGRFDVTKVVRWSLERDPFAPVQADNAITGDPRPGWRKKLHVEFRVGGEKSSIDLDEWTASTIPVLPPDGISLPGASRPFTILAARYGGGFSWADVTPVLRKMVTDPAQSFVFTEKEAGVDPRPGADESLVVWFDKGGRRYVRIFHKDACTLLP